VIIPKKKFASERGIDFTWEEMQAAALQTDLVDNKVAAINEQENATRFVIRKELRRNISSGRGFLFTLLEAPLLFDGRMKMEYNATNSIVFHL
jgi:hypothetical protein